MERLTREYGGGYVPEELYRVDGQGETCDLCCEYCKAAVDGSTDCSDCAISLCFNRLGTYENARKKIEDRLREIKTGTDYMHNLTGQMAEDFEWVLKLFEQ